jgi:Outer membrane protein beta-barrel domain
MTKTMSMMSLIAGLLVTFASGASAQTLVPQPESGPFFNVGVGGQPQTRSFGSSGTFTSFNETGRFDLTQNVGSGFFFDVGGGFQFTKHLGAGVSVWTVRSKSAISAAATIPDPVFFGRFTTVKAEPDSDKRQTTLGINLSVIYTQPVGQRLDVAVSLGPTIIRNRLDVGSVAIAPNSQTVTISTESQSKTTAKAGNLGFDITYRVNEMYNVGLFARYAGGEVDMPSVKALKVGGVQVGGLFRYRF